jgi:TonB family protein
MFNNLLEARRPIPRWVAPTLAAAILLHACALSGAIVHGYWDVDKLPVPRGRVDLVVPAPSPPPPAGARPSAPRPTSGEAVKRTAPETTQPIKLLDRKPALPAAGDSGSGASSGLGSGQGIGDGTGECVGIACGPDTDSEPPPDTRTRDDDEPEIRNRTQDEVDRNFLSGERQIHPDDATRTKMSRDGLTSARIIVKMCLSAAGRVTSLDMLASSGYPEYDAKIKARMRAWRYSAFGGDQIVCAPVTFLYNLR